ncbi:MAG: DUF6125 family protein [Desulfobacterales bacterium]|nr:DUF6125 family protein [Desulfobacterales bacterium]
MTQKLEDLDQNELVRLLLDMVQRMILHYGLWYTEVRHQVGEQKALALLTRQLERSLSLQLKRLSKVFGFSLTNGLPDFLRQLPAETMQQVLEQVSVSWLANDGIWFQTVEQACGMNDAKRCNDTCWAIFSPVEAESIRHFLKLDRQPGLEGLKQALGFRLYAVINVQSIVEETEDSFVFQMNECRVQAARKRKGLEDYPCKSAGLVEYAYFARTIDPRIKTECIGCPPDDHPEEWFCAWRFTVE